MKVIKVGRYMRQNDNYSVLYCLPDDDENTVRMTYSLEDFYSYSHGTFTWEQLGEMAEESTENGFPEWVELFEEEEIVEL